MLDSFFAALWEDYRRIAPHVSALRTALEARGETVVNDHVAFRTFAGPTLGIGALEPHLLALGYRRFAPYAFPDKHLDAWAYLHEEPTAPRVFLSELRRGVLSPEAERIIDRLVGAVDPERVKRPDVFWAGPLWPAVAFEEYETLARESEYAGWLAALGLRANHFTVSVNHLLATPTLEGSLALIEAAGGVVATAGGRIKGGPHEGLEQASTVADRQPVTFAGGVTRVIPTCYYELARRHPRPGDAEGRLYQGFVPASADRLFESTDRTASTA
jgi:hypothetical protein